MVTSFFGQSNNDYFFNTRSQLLAQILVKKIGEKGRNKFLGDKKSEQPADIKVRFATLQSGLCCSYYFNYPCNFLHDISL